MIDKKEYELAMEIVDKYKEQLNSTLITNRTCAICKENEITRVEESGGYKDPIMQESNCWNDGTVERISFGYGSTQHDMESYYIAVCDGCMTDLKESGHAISLREIKKQVREHEKIEAE